MYPGYHTTLPSDLTQLSTLLSITVWFFVLLNKHEEPHWRTTAFDYVGEYYLQKPHEVPSGLIVTHFNWCWNITQFWLSDFVSHNLLSNSPLAHKPSLHMQICECVFQHHNCGELDFWLWTGRIANWTMITCKSNKMFAQPYDKLEKWAKA